MKLIINKKAANKLVAYVLAGSLATGALSGCTIQEASDDLSSLDLLTTKNEESSSSLNRGVSQKKDVNGENFSLLINYLSGEEKWQINANKKLYIEIKTENLPDNLEVYIDNIHMDTSIVSTKAGFNGIMQDSMDDHIHNSLVLGFPIDNTNSYFGVNEIEGQNDSFISGYSYGNQYYTSGSITQKRYLESDYLEDGVWANKIDTVIDLLIVDKSTGVVLRQVSVDSTLLVEVNDTVSFIEGNELVTYDYDRDGTRKEISRVKER